VEKRGAVFCVQGGLQDTRHLRALSLTSSTHDNDNDVLVNTFTNSFRTIPPWPCLDNSNVVVVWARFQPGRLQQPAVLWPGVHAVGAKSARTSWSTSFISYNQRTPAVVALNGREFCL